MPESFDFYRLFPNPAVLDALGLLVTNPQHQYYQAEIANSINCTTLQVQRALGRLTDAGLVFVERRGKQVFYRANENHPAYEGLRMVVRNTIGLGNKLREALVQAGDSIAFAFVFGSVAEGLEGSNSDVDLFVVGSVRTRFLAELIGPVSRQFQREINPVVYPEAELLEKAAKENAFIKRVLSGKKHWLIGDSNEFKRLVA